MLREEHLTFSFFFLAFETGSVFEFFSMSVSLLMLGSCACLCFVAGFALD